jgi:hypothetical protein
MADSEASTTASVTMEERSAGDAAAFAGPGIFGLGVTSFWGSIKNRDDCVSSKSLEP